MSGLRFLEGPEERRAWVLTKLAVLGGTGILTVPLAHWIGPRAWIGFGVFAALLLLGTVAVLAATRRTGGPGEVPAFPREPSPPGDGASGTEPVDLPVEDALDLHPFAPAEIPSVVEEYVRAAWEAGFREVRLIHGRGIGVQRERVRSALARNPLVREIHDAPPERGGWGATVAHLVEER